MVYLLYLALVVLVNVAAAADINQPFLCVDGSRPVQCFLAPCSVANCEKHSDAKCEDDYCGGCNARFYINNTEVTNDCSDVAQPYLCADGSDPVECFVEPCAVTKCATHPGATCQDDYCGGCIARFYVSGKEVTRECRHVGHPFLCVDGNPPVQCLIEPCLFAHCNKHPSAKCQDDYCGGCHAKFYLNNTEVTNDCANDSVQ